MAFPPRGRVSSSLPGLVEISQIWRRLILFDRHQEAVRAEEIILLADNNVDVVLDADVFPPPDRSLGCNATVVFDHGPGTCESIVDHGDFVVQDVRISPVEPNPLFDDRLAIRVEWNAARVV